MNWKIRHQGSPKSVGNLTLQQVVDGLLDGHWEATDEVMGPSDTTWVAIENHPQLADIAADLELPPPKEHDDESRIDMNALIDVCLVLLVFFILTTTYAELQKIMSSPDLATNDKSLPVYTKEQVQDLFITARVTMEKNKPVIRIENTEVDEDALVPFLSRLRKSSKHSEMLIDHERQVPHGTIVKLEDAAKSASIGRILIAIPPDEVNK
jgi:biopolymer transport protein ExbD